MRIKELREEKHISQSALAVAIGTSQRNIGRWENRENEPTYSQLVKLADFFEVSIDYLVNRTDDFGNVNIITNGTELSKDEKTLLDCFDKLGPFEREAILIQVKALAKKWEEQPIKK